MNQIQLLDLDADFVAGDTSATAEQSYARFVRWVGAAVLAASLLANLFVAVIDPYGLFRLVDIEGFNRVKPLPEQYREQIKLANAKALRPNALLLGNSRIEVGLDPGSPQLGKHGYSAYSLALAGTSLTEAQRMFERVRSAVSPPAMVVQGVEFLDFLVDPAVPATVMDIPEPHPWQWRFDTLYSIKSVSDAGRTLLLQTRSDPETMTRRGQTPLHEYRSYARRDGYHRLFEQRAQENAKTLMRMPRSLHGSGGSSPSLERLRGMLARMAQDRTEVHLIIYPYHAQLMAMFYAAGLQTVMEEWKRLLTIEVDAIKRLHPDARVQLWDFSGFGPVQCEPIPAPGDRRATTRYYWEAGHFKSSVGELIQQRILGASSAFGVPLRAANLRDNQARIAAERARCEAAYPDMFSGARSLVSAAQRQTR